MGSEPEGSLSEQVEDELERHTRQLGELLQETRVAITGVQVLFGFLLAVVFQNRFGQITSLENDLYLAAILSATGATICFIAPTAYHRILFEQHDKPHLITIANRFLIVGVALLALAMTFALTLVCEVVFGGATAAIVAAVAVLGFGWFWFGLPLSRRAQGKHSH